MHKKILRSLGKKLDRLEDSHKPAKLKRYLKTEKKLAGINRRLKA